MGRTIVGLVHLLCAGWKGLVQVGQGLVPVCVLLIQGLAAAQFVNPTSERQGGPSLLLKGGGTPALAHSICVDGHVHAPKNLTCPLANGNIGINLRELLN